MKSWPTIGHARRRVLSSVALLASVWLATQQLVAADDDTLKVRRFLFTYQATVADLEPGSVARVWLPVPPTNDEQEALIEKLPPGVRIDKESKYGNLMLYAAVKADKDGTASLSVTYRVTRHEVQAEPDESGDELAGLELFLRPDARVPIGGKPLMLLQDRKLPKDQLEAARVLYDVVNNHMRYSKDGTGWGNGDSEWACDSKYGNCSDFHSLFISLARSQKIPAKFEMGFPLPAKRGTGEIAGYHCWAKFKPTGRGWVPVDISEANKNPRMKEYYFGRLTEDRVAFSVGRDLTLVPKQDGPPLNFFIYPYVEVDGSPYAAAKVKRSFTFEDVP